MNTKNTSNSPIHWVFVGSLSGLAGFVAYRYAHLEYQLSFGPSVLIGFALSVIFGLVAFRPADVLTAIKSAFGEAVFAHHSRKRRKQTQHEEWLAWTRVRKNKKDLMYQKITRRTKRLITFMRWAVLFSWAMTLSYAFLAIHLKQPTADFWMTIIVVGFLSTLVLRGIIFFGALIEPKDDPFEDVYLCEVLGRRRHRKDCTKSLKQTFHSLLMFNPIGISILFTGMVLSIVAFTCLGIGKFIQYVPELSRKVYRKSRIGIVTGTLFVLIFFSRLFLLLNTRARLAIFTCSFVGFMSGVVAEWFGAYREAPLICLAAGFAFGLVEYLVYRQFERRVRGFLSRCVRTRGGFC